MGRRSRSESQSSPVPSRNRRRRLLLGSTSVPDTALPPERRPEPTQPPVAASAPTRQVDSELESIRRIVRGEHSVTWVFAGDELSAGCEEGATKRNFSELLGATLKQHPARRSDIVINSAQPGETSLSLLTNLHWRVLRFRPQIVSVMLGLHDALGARCSIDQFQTNMEQIIMEVRDHDVAIFLQTPPCPEDERTRCLMAPYVAALIDIAEHLGVATIDHWDDLPEQPQAARHSGASQMSPLHPQIAEQLWSILLEQTQTQPNLPRRVASTGKHDARS